MKKLLFSIILITIIPILSNAQYSTKGENLNRSVKGYPPHGYPCLGCAPCKPITNPIEYCDLDNLKKVSPHPDALALGFVFADGKMIPLNSFVKRAGIKNILVGLGYIDAYDASTSRDKSSARYVKVKCDCGTNIYGKDADACVRICDFLKDFPEVK